MAATIAMLSDSPLISTSPYSMPQSQISVMDSSPYASQHSRTPSTRPRPRLALNTSCQRTLPGKGASALRTDTMSVVSPTASNTYKNTFDTCTTPTVLLDTQQPVKPKLSLKLAVVAAPSLVVPPGSNIPSSPTSTSSSSSIINSPSTVPYNMPSHLRSILSNSPFTHPLNNRITTSSATSTRRFFPSAKRVTFRAQLVEEISTTKYILRSSDLPSRDTSPVLGDELQVVGYQAKPASKREASATPTGDVDDTGDYEKSGTPVIGRRKKIRDWTWTLGPVTSMPEHQAGEITNGST